MYHSALPLSPSSSWLYECYIAELAQEVRVVKGLPKEWGGCSRTVLLDNKPTALSYWNNKVAVGSEHRDILILDAITGSQTAIFPGHTDVVGCLMFLFDGTSLVSGSNDNTVKLWDVQTGGVVKTFSGHTSWVNSVSISADNTTIASASMDLTIRLWDIQTGTCHQIIGDEDGASCIKFSPTNPQTLFSSSDGWIVQWDIDGHYIGLIHNGYQIAFSPDGTQCILREEEDVTIQNINSGVIVAQFYMSSSSHSSCCCFSPDGTLLAVVNNNTDVCVLYIAGTDLYLIETFTGHATSITSLVFSSPSSLISTSDDKSVKFWWIGTSLTNQVVTDPKSTAFNLASTKSTKNGPIIPIDLPDGVMKTWGVSTRSYKGSLQISDKDSHQSNILLIDSVLIFVWYTDGKINIWDAGQGELLHTIDVPGGTVKDLRVSGDGSKVFCLYEESIQAWDIWTREAVGKGEFQSNKNKESFFSSSPSIVATDASKVWINAGFFMGVHGWDFGILGLPPHKLSNELPDMHHLNDTKLWEIDMSRMKDIATGKVVFQLPERFGKPLHVQCSGQCLVAHLRSKEVLVLDFSHVFI